MSPFGAFVEKKPLIETQVQLPPLHVLHSPPIKDDFVVVFQQFKVVNLVRQFEVLQVSQVEVHAARLEQLIGHHSQLLFEFVLDHYVVGGDVSTLTLSDVRGERRSSGDVRFVRLVTKVD